MSITSPSSSNAPEVFSMISASISGLISISITLTVLFSPNMRKSHFNRLIMTVATCVFLGCVPYSFGYPSSDAFCFIQGIFSFVFFRMADFFTTAISFQMYCLCTCGKLYLREYYIHLICWIVSIILTVIPLSASVTYGSVTPDSNGDQDSCYCGLDLSNQTPTNGGMWLGITFAFPLLFNISLCTFFCLRITTFLYRARLTVNHKVMSMVRCLSLYPLALIISWLPVCIMSMYSTSTNDFSNVVMFTAFKYGNALGSLHGLYLGIIFYTTSRDAQVYWSRILPCNICDPKPNTVIGAGKHFDLILPEISDLDLYSCGLLLSSPLSSLEFSVDKSFSSRRVSSTVEMSSGGTLAPLPEDI